MGLPLSWPRSRDKEKAFLYLQKVSEEGFCGEPEQLAADPGFADLKSDPRFARILEQVHTIKGPAPIRFDGLVPGSRTWSVERDRSERRKIANSIFWLGEWNVVTSQEETPAGESKIELILGACVIQENWASAGNIGYSGKSYNVYNTALKRWEQYWVDNAAGNIFFYGGLKDGVMDDWSDEIPQSDGKKLKRHLQFIRINPDTVRQFSRGSNDQGKTWFVEYDFTYRRKK